MENQKINLRWLNLCGRSSVCLLIVLLLFVILMNEGSFSFHIGVSLGDSVENIIFDLNK